MCKWIGACFILASLNIHAKGFYINWGYNRDYWSESDIHVRQPSLGNNFVIKNVKAEDLAQWNEGGYIFDKNISTPQFNFRSGFFFDDHLGVEFSVDHTKYTSIIGQSALVQGTINNQAVDAIKVLDEKYFSYNLHNGANHIMLSAMWRQALDFIPLKNIFAIVKGGGGFMLPHAENTILGNRGSVGPKEVSNAVGLTHGWWQLAGWTYGAEVALRCDIYEDFFLEIADKEAYAKMDTVPIYAGRASQAVWMNEALFVLGYTFN